ncbi:hypothetical protein SPFM17_00186 [Salmonella phage SPFM17]|jgi:hypothetical protein|nr:hypothetical protein LFCCKGHI_00018 [Salmonella phage MET_P1_082_240]WNT47996.1 hypothetical protein SPLA3_PHROGS00191 [Salmonella phage SPLA3]WNT48685.1 hypothetical protein SPLA5c_PHROGS00193 [Salmonella phage SPLA5c]VFR10667.1 hypothetical protein SPFM4_00174 [Salmonella phage SPFM4]VFR12345.1 hypothetical protein SPFM11_00038 [Salmonella phage SPFM11]VFR12911.1 hypothetical protein SPFM13_00142 [Salmonella phage SPFM13]VFR14098.1 hypothetical protein SPFM17_00186 [Salmonella phage SPFM
MIEGIVLTGIALWLIRGAWGWIIRTKGWAFHGKT